MMDDGGGGGGGNDDDENDAGSGGGRRAKRKSSRFLRIMGAVRLITIRFYKPFMKLSFLVRCSSHVNECCTDEG